MAKRIYRSGQRKTKIYRDSTGKPLNININKSGSGSGSGSLSASYQKALDESKAANLQRYADIDKGYSDRFASAMSTMEGLGDQERADISSRYRGLQSSQQQDLTSRGLTGTTILPTMQQGVAQQETAAQGRLGERLRREKLGYQTQLSGEQLAFQERRNDIGPDLGMLMQLAQMQGSASGGSGFTSSSRMGGGRRVSRAPMKNTLRNQYDAFQKKWQAQKSRNRFGGAIGAATGGIGGV